MRPFSPTVILRFTLFVLLLASCAPRPPSPTPTETAQPVAPTEAPPTASPVPPTETLTPAPSLPRPRYKLFATLDYKRKRVSVDESIVYVNATDETLQELVLAVMPNLWPSVFKLSTLNLNGTATTDYELDGQRLTVHLREPLASGATVELSLAFGLILPELDPELNTKQIRPNIFGYTAHQMNLVNWYPFIVPRLSGEWILHDAWYYGEHLVYETADFEVNIKNADANVRPTFAASALEEPNGEWTRYTLDNARTFAISASTEWRRSGASAGGVFIVSYYLPEYEAAGKAAANVAARAIEVFAERFGPYPHRSLTIAMSDFNDGAEFSGFFFLSKGFYRSYDSTSRNYLTMISAHETAHQWWFEQVANDQFLEPWLDEALCTYSERLYFEHVDWPLLDWWWKTRIDSFQPQGYVDIPLNTRFDNGFRQYTNAVYFRGAHFLEDLRTRIGDAAFFAFLQDYLAQERGKIATSTDFFSILRQHTDADISDLVNEYFQTAH